MELLKLPAARSANVTASETNSAMNETFLRIVAILRSLVVSGYRKNRWRGGGAYANRNVTIDQVVRKIPTAEANSAWSVP